MRRLAMVGRVSLLLRYLSRTLPLDNDNTMGRQSGLMANKAQTSAKSGSSLPVSSPDHELCARLVIREGKTFKEAAVTAGYAPASAGKGLKVMMAESSLLTAAIEAEWRRLQMDATRLKPIAVGRLFREIADPNSTQGIRAIEVAGKFKETDWFVRSAPDVQIGIINSIGDANETTAIAEYKALVESSE